jgi:hypothetical protein
MIHHRRRTFAGLLSLFAGSALVGCFSVSPFPVTGAAIGGTTLGVLAANAPLGGPLVVFENTSDHPIALRLWVGKVNVSTPLGIDDIRTRDSLAIIIGPGQREGIAAGRPGWSTGNDDGVVWIEARALPTPAPRNAGTGDDVEPALEASPSERAWYELERPGPYEVMLVLNDRNEVLLDGVEHRPLPPGLWIDGRNGELPVWDQLPVMP